MKFKVGDRVTIKCNIKHSEQPGVTESMLKFLGKKCNISMLSGDNVKLDIDGSYYSWNTNWLIKDKWHNITI